MLVARRRILRRKQFKESNAVQHLGDAAQPVLELRRTHIVQHVGADDQVEGAAEIGDAFDRQLVKIEIVQAVRSFEIGGVAEAEKPGSRAGAFRRLTD